MSSTRHKRVTRVFDGGYRFADKETCALNKARRIAAPGVMTLVMSSMYELLHNRPTLPVAFWVGPPSRKRS
jgi:hypothetical protein